MILNSILQLSALTLALGGCAHSPQCGNPEGAKVIIEGQKSCAIRIRQVIIGTDLKIPESLKNSQLANSEILWQDPYLSNGQIVGGHFIIKPITTAHDQSAKRTKDSL